MDVMFWISLGLIIVVSVYNEFSKIRKQRSQIEKESEDEVVETESMNENSDIEAEDPLYYNPMDSQDVDDTVEEQVVKPVEKDAHSVNDDQIVERGEEPVFDLRQAVISQAILQNDYINNRN